MTMRDDIIGELESFADAESGISVESLAHTPQVTRILGHGSPEQAFHALVGIRRRNKSRDVAAAFAHIGLDRSASNVEDRLNEFALTWAERMGLPVTEAPSSRTVRRWSKSGILMLAVQLIEGSGVEPPSLHLDLLHKSPSSFIMLPSLFWMSGYEMGPARWIVIGAETHSSGEVRPEDCEEHGRGFLQPRNALEFDVGIPTLVRWTWLGETQPTYQIRHIGVPANLMTMTVHTPGGAGSVIYREGDDIDAIADLAEALDPRIEEYL